MAEYSANAVQIVNPREAVVFTESPVPCNRGFVRHRDGTGTFLLAGIVPKSKCPCRQARSANYLVDFGANISIPTGKYSIKRIESITFCRSSFKSIYVDEINIL